MKKFCFSLLLGLILSNQAVGGEKPKKVIDKKFIVASSVMASSIGFDMWTTRRNLDRGATEQNWMYGRRPGNPRLIGTSVGLFAVNTGAMYLVKKWFPRKPWWVIVPAIVVQGRIHASVNNIQGYRY